MPELNGFPGTPEVWRDTDTGQSYLVYYVPDVEPPIPLLWTIDTEQLEAGFGTGNRITYDREASTDVINAAGALHRGDHTQVVNTGEDPYLAWENAVTNQAAARPYLLDEEVLALIAEGLVENRPIQLAEFQQTQWWQTHSEGEREWLVLNVADPITAAQRLESNRIVIADHLATIGINNAPDDVVNFLSDRFTSGQWTQAQWQNQARALSDPFAGIAIDPELADVVASVGEIDTTKAAENDVAQLVRRWLGPMHGAWEPGQVAEWAGRIRNDPDAQDELLAMLKSQRLALFPEHTNDNLSYEDIAAPWRNVVAQSWGQAPDETDPFFSQLVRLNDVTEAGKLLRSEGLKRNVGAVREQVFGGFLDTFGQVRSPLA